jgi:hypothetical protein
LLRANPFLLLLSAASAEKGKIGDSTTITMVDKRFYIFPHSSGSADLFGALAPKIEEDETD